MTSPWRVLLAVFVGGCLGGLARDLLAGDRPTTLLVNLAGCLLLGALVVTVPSSWRPLLATGFCGAFTTFGSVMVSALDGGDRGAGLGYVGVTLLGGIAAAAVGLALGRRLAHQQIPAPEDPDVEFG